MDFEIFNDVEARTNELISVLVRGEWFLRLVEPSCKWPISSMFVYWRHYAVQLAIDLEITLTIAHDERLLMWDIRKLQSVSSIKVFPEEEWQR